MQDASCAHEETIEQRRIAQLETALAAATLELEQAKLTIARLREKYTHALEQLQLLHRRLFIAKAERADTSAAQLAFDSMFEKVQGLAKELSAAEEAAKNTNGGSSEEAVKTTTEEGPEHAGDAGANGPEKKGDGRKNRATPPTGRRDLSKAALPTVRVEVPDPELEGKAERIGVEESQRLGYERGGQRRIVIARIVYKKPDEAVMTKPLAEETDAASTNTAAPPENATPSPRIVTAPMPKEIVRRGMLAPSMIAHVLVQKHVMGVPFYRLEQRFTFDGFSLDRGTMCRYAEEIGSALGEIVEAARKEALTSAFCLSTDATGVALQPTPLEEGKRQPCRKGHFFVTLADRDHVFFDFQPKHTSLTVWEMFKGYSGYIQADAHVIYDALFRGTPPEGADDTTPRGPPPTEVGCLSHARRKFWEAAVCKYVVGLEGLRRLDAIFAADRPLADLPPSQRKARRDALVRPLVDTFFAWVKTEHPKVTGRGLVATALGYAINQEQPLRRFLDDGRLRLENNAAERSLRTIAIGLSLCTPSSSTRNHESTIVA